jgi:phosphonate transport system substrate-binding protein
MTKWLLLRILFFVLLLGCGQAFGAASSDAIKPTEIRIGLGPLGVKETVRQGAEALAKLLQDETGIHVSIYLAKNYANLAQAVKDKKVDFVFLSALSFVKLEKESQLQVLLKHVWQEPFYYSVLLTSKGSGFKSVQDLKGKKIAFVDKRSTSGYLYPKVMLKKNKISENFFAEVRYSASHNESVALLNKKMVDGIFVFADSADGKKSAWNKFTEVTDLNSQPEILWVSEPIPNDPFCVRQEFYEKYPKTVHTIMYSLIDANQKLAGHAGVVEILSAKGFLPATTRQYDPVREMVKELGIGNSTEDL